MTPPRMCVCVVRGGGRTPRRDFIGATRALANGSRAHSHAPTRVRACSAPLDRARRTPHSCLVWLTRATLQGRSTPPAARAVALSATGLADDRHTLSADPM